MYDETARQSVKTPPIVDKIYGEGKTFINYLADKDILSGIKVDIGLFPIEGTKDETSTEGLDGLDQRCKEYYQMGCRFAKWRAVFKISEKDGTPSEEAIKKNAYNLARYGRIC